MPLSDAVPALENFGFRVLDEMPTGLAAARLGQIHDFRFDLPGRRGSPRCSRAPGRSSRRSPPCLRGEAENDVFNRLVLFAGLEPQAGGLAARLVPLSAPDQRGLSASPPWSMRCAARPAATKRAGRAVPAAPRPGLRAATATATAAKRRGELRRSACRRSPRSTTTACCGSSGVDRRDPAHQRVRPGGERGAGVQDRHSALVPGLPTPVPWREIFVYSPRVEGIHLRAGPVARGGLRWSDRRDDFRTEVLGLMKAQRVKNAVIVPTGAKGGFYPKRLPDPAIDRDAWVAEGTESYRSSSARCCRSPTTSSTARSCIPAGVVIHDGEDPYFVVAADKGTASFLRHRQRHRRWSAASGSATLSPAAARRATTTRRWASPPGARGFRCSGISSKWASTCRRSRSRRRLRRHVGRRVRQRHAAVEGDQAGRRVRPPAHVHRSRSRSGEELGGAQAPVRAAALELGRLRPHDAVSKGGGMFPRTQKSIPLSSEARAALGIEAETLDPESLINAILKAPVDLMWFGGIGTYVKASHGAACRRSATRPTTRFASTPAKLRAKVDRRRRQPRRHPGRRASSSRCTAGASTPTSSTIRPGSIARTTRSTSRSRSSREMREGELSEASATRCWRG